MIVGLGWTCSGSIDLDASIHCLDANKRCVDTISFKRKNGSGISHRGDNTTGEGTGDDERIRIEFGNVPA